VPYLICLALLLASCLPKPLPELPEPTHRQQKLFQASFDETWKAAHATVEESLMRITEDDAAQGTLHAAMHRSAQRTSPQGLEREVTRIAELHKARQHGLGRVAEYAVEYTVEVHPGGDDRTGLNVSTEITAIDYQLIILPPGIAHAVPRSFEVPSKGVLERHFVEQIAAHLLLSEEMLYSLGTLGRD
jgi:hypothetical protein